MLLAQNFRGIETRGQAIAVIQVNTVMQGKLLILRYWKAEKQSLSDKEKQPNRQRKSPSRISFLKLFEIMFKRTNKNNEKINELS